LVWERRKDGEKESKKKQPKRKKEGSQKREGVSAQGFKGDGASTEDRGNHRALQGDGKGISAPAGGEDRVFYLSFGCIPV
jgi:hypothetical protein